MRDKNLTKLSGRGLVALFLTVSEVFLAIRFVLHFFAVNPANGFAAWVFNSTDALVAPFRGVFTTTVAGHPHYVDLQTLFIMFAWVVVCAVLTAVIVWSNSERVARKR
jgi:hypothetical protein